MHLSTSNIFTLQVLIIVLPICRSPIWC